ncbi:hypothetical protein [Longimicrobium terrae]|uniref:Uncharacterized protein n=1 Tax=Longimicrobium terrae TaxID=1639882 RepID=A0A841H212_9BACT|nr:hypothetical protein [Longimicrobium terrae]MBB4637636.1 hypothetical protein [Longimicrobium terrae]MBB6072033.1 hypothetical protein [Longimicrobium terrae]NNC29881.1 hypothetical protein [Longimicrobium terrae]
MDVRAVLTTAAVLVLAGSIVYSSDGEDGSSRFCRFQYQGARTARDTAAADGTLVSRRPYEETCGMLRRDGTLARYEASHPAVESE